MWRVRLETSRYDPRMHIQLKRALLLFAVTTSGLASGAQPVPYPDDFRSWSHVKSGVIGPQHKSFASNGGIHHVYANEEAMEGYRSRSVPEKSVIVFEWLEWAEKDGAVLEGPRRQVDVMVRDS
ncbi:MAG TPA: cytochrome P460 family protein, partial [Steroidobacteraceae bacterium]|nr:cytochrome P460 family protein [Steroidobacteraceae bacterium]